MQMCMEEKTSLNKRGYGEVDFEETRLWESLGKRALGLSCEAAGYGARMASGSLELTFRSPDVARAKQSC